jgi:hypothetical protein
MEHKKQSSDVTIDCYVAEILSSLNNNSNIHSDKKIGFFTEPFLSSVI